MITLVTYASKHGSTQEVAERIAGKLRQSGVEVEVRPVADAGDVGAYGAVVIGSAIYYGSWMKDATEFVRRNRDALATRPVWLYSVGPLGVEVKDTEEQPKELAELREAINPRDHRIFFGALDHNKLAFAERLVIKAVRAPEGDYRDWDAIEMWAEDIARQLVPVAH